MTDVHEAVMTTVEHCGAAEVGKMMHGQTKDRALFHPEVRAFWSKIAMQLLISLFQLFQLHPLLRNLQPLLTRILTAGHDMPRETQPVGITDKQIAAAVLELVSRRGAESSACPSEVARSLSPNSWRLLMPQVRQVAAQLAQTGFIQVTQRGTVLNPTDAWRGPIRIRLPPHPPAPF